MATKYQFITDIYKSTIDNVTATPAAWTAFLRSACRNYKCRFDEQILIYAQRPDATAVLEFDKWNKQFGRRINRGATGIAVFDDEHNGNTRLKHYFDISDTRESEFASPVPLWSMKQEYESEVIESLENSFGDLDDKSTFVEAVVSATRNAVADNMADYVTDLMNCRDGSVLEEFDDEYAENEYRLILHRSVAYMVLTRCGIDADYYLSDFRSIAHFNTPNTVNAIGLAASDIAESCLREISATVWNLQRAEQNKNRTFALPENPVHNVPVKQNEERGVDNGTDLSHGGRLPSAEPDRAGGTARSPWQIRVTPKEIPQTEPQNLVRESADVGQAERTPDGNRSGGNEPNGAVDLTDGGGAGRDGADESRESDAMGRPDEQHPTERGGIGTQRPYLQLNMLTFVFDFQQVSGVNIVFFFNLSAGKP